MYASLPQKYASISELFRWFAMASSTVLFVGCISLIVQDLAGDGKVTSQGAIQAVALAVVFAGYAIGWRYELAGSLIVIFGTVLFFTVCEVTYGQLPGLAAAWFAFPALLYLLAWYTRKKYGTLIL
jgi:hypothetical protein